MSPSDRRSNYADALNYRQEAETARDAKIGTLVSLGHPAKVSVAGKPPLSVQDLGGNHADGSLQVVHRPLGSSQGRIKEQ